jgi:hypothetical protein
VFECPVLDCGYTYTPDAKLIPDMGPLDGVLGLAPGTMARQAVHQNNEEIERTLRAHLDGHTSVEWLRTTMQLQRALDERRASDGDPRTAQVCLDAAKHDAHAWTTDAGTRWCPGRYV